MLGKGIKQMKSGIQKLKKFMAWLRGNYTFWKWPKYEQPRCPCDCMDRQEISDSPSKWFVREDDRTWCLFYGQQNGCTLDLQIIKAPKIDTPYAEYWPTPEQTKFILDALNRAERAKELGKQI
jgi:hypothetical protein